MPLCLVIFSRLPISIMFYFLSARHRHFKNCIIPVQMSLKARGEMPRGRIYDTDFNAQRMLSNETDKVWGQIRKERDCGWHMDRPLVIRV